MLTDWMARGRALFRRSAVERDLDDELRFHLDRQIDALVAGGLDRSEAARRARLAFGGLDQIKDECRDARGVAPLEGLGRDFGGAARALTRQPGFAAIVIATLALGIGPNTAIFSILDSLILRPLPVREPGRLVQLTSDGVFRRTSWTNPIWESIRERPDLFDGALAYSSDQFNMARAGEADPISGLWVSGGFFDVLGVRAIAGRTFNTRDDLRGGSAGGPVAVVSYGFWQRRLGGAPEAIGRSISLERVPYTVVGVLPREFSGPQVGRAYDVYVPLATEPRIRGKESFLNERTTWWLTVLARLRPPDTIERATAALRAVQPQIRAATLPEGSDAGRYLKDPLALDPAAAGYSRLRGEYRQPLLIVMAVVALVLLIACANIANLMLGRAAEREHETSVRVALGASPWQLSRPLVCESLLLSAAGAVTGVGIAAWGSRLLLAQISSDTEPVFLDLTIDWRVLAFTAVAALATALLFSMAPALRAARASPNDALKERARSIAGDRRFGVSSLLVVAQIALTLVLVISALLFARAFAFLAHVDLGFQPDGLMVATVDAHRSRVVPERRAELYTRVVEAVRSVGGVSAAGASFTTPLEGKEWDILVDSPPGLDLSERDRDVWVNVVSPGWFATLGTPILAGHDFEERDRPGAPDAVIVNETFVKRFLRGGSPIGAIVRQSPPGRKVAVYHVVGVARDAVYDSLRDPVPPTIYRALMQWTTPQGSFDFTLRVGAGGSERLTPQVTAAIVGVDPELAVRFRPLARQVEANLLQERLLARLSAFFGSLALVLAALGLYGVISYGVARRRTEIGIRLALGSTKAAIVGLVLARAVALMGMGISIGAVGAWWASAFLRTLLFGVAARDLVSFSGAIAVLAAVGGAAAWIPARRAAAADPAAVLREGA